MNNNDLVNSEKSVPLGWIELVTGLILADVAPLLLFSKNEVVIPLVVHKANALDLVIEHLLSIVDAARNAHLVVMMEHYLLINSFE